MHNIVSRVTKASGTFTTGLVYLVLALAAISFVQDNVIRQAQPSASVSALDIKAAMRTAHRAGSVRSKPKENLKFAFDLDADLTPLFSWNTKQVFVYLSVEYGGARKDIHNEAVIWDKIITSKDQAKLKLKKQRGKYNIWDVRDTFEGREANVTLHYDVQPHVGFLRQGTVQSKKPVTIKFPSAEESQ